jgi:glutaconate CoA-transferase subunit A
MTEQEAVSKFVSDGDYLCYDCNMIMRGPSSIIREIIRQKKQNLGVGARFTYLIVGLLNGAGCLSRVDVGFMGIGNFNLLFNHRVKITEWTNSAMTMRLMSGSLGIPFMPIRFLGGTDAFKYSSAKLVKDPWTGEPTIMVPALNPDVGIIHVHQCDKYGNARIYGPSVSPVEIAGASKKVIISTEEIIDNDYIRRDPGKTTIPYYLVDAVVHAPFGCHPGEVAGRYTSDTESIMEVMRACGDPTENIMREYLERYIYSVADHREYLEKCVGISKLLQLTEQASIKQGYF